MESAVAGAGTAAAAGGSNTLLIVGALIVVVVIIGAAYFFLIAPGSSSNSGQQSVSAVTPQVLAILPPNQTKSFSGVLSGIAQNIAQIQPISISYKGYAELGSGFLTFTIPLNLSYAHDGDSSKLIFNASKIPIVGNITSEYVRVNSTSTYSCTKASSYENGTAVPGSFQCTPLVGVSSVVQALETQNSTSTADITGESTNTTFDVTMHSYGTRYYNNQPCLFVMGSASSSTSTDGINENSTYQIGMCLSGQYSVPLNFTLVGSSGVNASTASHFVIQIGESSISTPTSQSQIASLPGPVVNSTV